jgi:hypothetical protein
MPSDACRIGNTLNKTRGHQRRPRLSDSHSEFYESASCSVHTIPRVQIDQALINDCLMKVYEALRSWWMRQQLADETNLTASDSFRHNSGAAAIRTLAAVLQFAATFAHIAYIFTGTRCAGRGVIARIELVLWWSTHRAIPNRSNVNI